MVVYKVDRLSRSLLDFARLIGTLEQCPVRVGLCSVLFGLCSILLGFGPFMHAFVPLFFSLCQPESKPAGDRASVHPDTHMDALGGEESKLTGYGISQQKSKRVEEIFGWLKTVGMLRKTRHKGVRRVGWVFAFAAAAYNLVRVRNLASVLSPAVV